MISLQRSMHSSQMYTPGPAMSFLTCFWLFPQNEHLSRSPPSPMRATQLSPLRGPPAREAAAQMRPDGPRRSGFRVLFDVTVSEELGKPFVRKCDGEAPVWASPPVFL